MSSVTNLLMPGGPGFVGSNTLVEILLKTNIKTVLIDNMANCYEDVLDRVKEIVSSKVNTE